jgi:hypothetical protein
LATRPQWLGEISQAGSIIRTKARVLVGERAGGTLARRSVLAEETP